MTVTDLGRPASSAPPADTAYDSFYPYYAEVCALSEIRKKPGLGIALRSGIGGHAILVLHGVCRDLRAGYPTLKLRDSGAPPGQAVGISVNSHYRNANWVAADGPDFLFLGALEHGEALTPESYRRTQDRAKALGVLEGVEFHTELFKDKPPGMSERDYMYEISVATDYGLRFGRDIFRARVPLDRDRMARVIFYLNNLNRPYREGERIFRWKVLNNNCCHIAHNALAAAGIWAPWPTGQFFAAAAFNFPVPKNEFVDLMLRANDLPITDPQAMYNDRAARKALLETGTLPVAPGALAIAERAVRNNEIYDIAGLRLIFYDNPFWGPYRFRFARIFSQARYTSLRENLLHFARLYAAVPAPGRAKFTGERARFQAAYEQYIARQAARVKQRLERVAP